MLQFLWWWALDYAQDGDLTQYTPEDIALACDWEDNPTTLIDALVNCGPGNKAGFLERDGGLYIHNWHDYAGKLIDKRQKDADRKRSSRSVQRTSDGCPTDGAGTVPNPTVPNQPNSTNPTNQPKNSDAGKPKRKAQQPLSKTQQALFDRFWEAYPNRKSKGDAEKAWAKIKPDDTFADKIMIALECAKVSHQWAKEGGNYIPHPATWLNAKGWEDDYSEATVASRASPEPKGFAGIKAFLANAREGEECHDP